MTMLETPPDTAHAQGSTPVLESRRLVLRAPCIEDVSAIAELANNRKIAEMTATMPFPYTLEDARAFVSRGSFSADSAIFALHLKQEHGTIFIGMCGYTPRPGESTPELGYWLGQPYWGKGLATEAIQAVLEYAFTQTPVTAITGSCRVVNAISRRVLEKCGFWWQSVGLWQVKALGASLPMDRFRLERGEWAARNGQALCHADISQRVAVPRASGATH